MNGTQPHITFFVSSSNSGATALRISWQRAVQLPQPVLARVCSFSCASVLTPFVWIASMIAPLVTPTQPQTVALSAICAMSSAGVRDRRREEQMAALILQIGARPQPVHVAMAVRRVADENHAGQPAVAHHDLLVDAERRILEAHGLGARVAPVAGREDLDAHDLELRAQHAAGIRRALVAGHRRGQHLRLLDQRRHQAVADAVVLDALADREDVGHRTSPCGR